MAERGGFEPPVQLPTRWFSKPVHSAALAPLRARRARRSAARAPGSFQTPSGPTTWPGSDSGSPASFALKERLQERGRLFGEDSFCDRGSVVETLVREDLAERGTAPELGISSPPDDSPYSSMGECPGTHETGLQRRETGRPNQPLGPHSPGRIPDGQEFRMGSWVDQGPGLVVTTADDLLTEDDHRTNRDLIELTSQLGLGEGEAHEAQVFLFEGRHWMDRDQSRLRERTEEGYRALHGASKGTRGLPCYPAYARPRPAWFGTPHRIRTCNLLIRSQVLYPVEPGVH